MRMRRALTATATVAVLALSAPARVTPGRRPEAGAVRPRRPPAPAPRPRRPRTTTPSPRPGPRQPGRARTRPTSSSPAARPSTRTPSRRSSRSKGVTSVDRHLAVRGGDREPGADRRRGRPGDVPDLRAAEVAELPGGLGPGGRRRAGPEDAAQGQGPDGRRRATSSSGAATDAPTVHVGAFIQQQPLIDAVVNQTWVETLGMTPRQRAAGAHRATRRPKPVRDEIEKLLGEDTSAPAGRHGHPARASTRAPPRSRSSPAPSPTRSASSATPCSAAAGSRPTRPGCAATSPPRWCRSSARSPATS